MVFSATFSYIVAVNFIAGEAGGNQDLTQVTDKQFQVEQHVYHDYFVVIPGWLCSMLKAFRIDFFLY
jgi:hypothetical protein